MVKLELDESNGYTSLTSIETVTVNEKQTENGSSSTTNAAPPSSATELVNNFNNSCSLNNNNNQSETMKVDLLHTEIATAIPTDLQTDTAATTANPTTHQNNIKSKIMKFFRPGFLRPEFRSFKRTFRRPNSCS